MRCLACNKQLSDRESTRKYAGSQNFVDLCDGCFGHVADQISTNHHEDDDYATDFSSMEDNDVQ